MDIEVQTDITQAILETVKEYLAEFKHAAVPVRSPYDINCGWCDDFSQDVFLKLGIGPGDESAEACTLEYANLTGKPGADLADGIFYQDHLNSCLKKLPIWITADLLNRTDLGSSGKHVFMYYKERYYDAECPEGVDDPFLLPIAMRSLAAVCPN